MLINSTEFAREKEQKLTSPTENNNAQCHSETDVYLPYYDAIYILVLQTLMLLFRPPNYRNTVQDIRINLGLLPFGAFIFDTMYVFFSLILSIFSLHPFFQNLAQLPNQKQTETKVFWYLSLSEIYTYILFFFYFSPPLFISSFVIISQLLSKNLT